MAWLMTHSLLSAWLYSMRDNPFADATTDDTSQEDFLRTLRREPTPMTDAIQRGIDFENMVTALTMGKPTDPQKSAWLDAAKNVAGIVKGAQLQYVAKKNVSLDGMDLLLYGRFDALKAGKIYDIKFTGSYDRGKYLDSTQHPMYLELMPTAKEFTYLVSNGTEVWTETYRRDETLSIYPTIHGFLQYLNDTGLIRIYKEKWGAK